MVCTNLTEREVKSGHWMAREKPNETNQIIKEWLEDLKKQTGNGFKPFPVKKKELVAKPQA